MNPRQTALAMALSKVAQGGQGSSGGMEDQMMQQQMSGEVGANAGAPAPDLQTMMGELHSIASSGQLPPEVAAKVQQAVQQLTEMYQQVARSGQDPAQVIGPKVKQLYDFVKQQMSGAGGQLPEPNTANLSGAPA